MDARDELTGGEWLCDVVVCTDLQANHLVHLAIFGGEHDDRHVGALAKLSTYLDARKAGQHQVEEHQICTATVELRNAIGPGPCGGYLKPLLPQHVAERV